MLSMELNCSTLRKQASSFKSTALRFTDGSRLGLFPSLKRSVGQVCGLGLLCLLTSQALASETQRISPSQRKQAQEALRAFKDSLLSAEIRTDEAGRKWNWTRLAPSVGYEAYRQNLTISVNLPQVGAWSREKAQAEAEIDRKQRESRLSFRLDSIRLESSVDQLEILLGQLDLQRSAMGYEKQILEMKEKGSKKGELPPSEFLQAKASFEGKRANFLSQVSSCQLKQAQIEEICNCRFRIELGELP